MVCEKGLAKNCHKLSMHEGDFINKEAIRIISEVELTYLLDKERNLLNGNYSTLPVGLLTAPKRKWIF